MISDDKRADILAAHYAECCEGLSKRIDLRTRLGLACALTWTLVLYKVYDPSQFSKLTTGFLAQYTETKETQAPQWFVGSLLWFALVFMVIELYVASTHIEIDAAYLRRLERDLARLTGPDFPSVWCGPGPKPKLVRQSNRF